MTENGFSFTISADIAEIPAVSARLEQAMFTFGFSSEEVLDTQLAVEEILTNIAVHGYGGNGGPVSISCKFEDRSIEIRIVDSAPPFDPLAMPEPDIETGVNDRKIGGLGIYLVRQVMDDTGYRFEKGKNILTLKKRHR